MLWLAIFHSYVVFQFKPLNFLLETCGYGGVDIFMFLSGFGLYYAYKKNNDYGSFIKKRVLRIFPYNIINCLIQMVLFSFPIFYVITDILGLSILTRSNLVNWYTSFMVFIYLLTPLYLKVYNTKPTVITVISIILVSVICFLYNEQRFTYIFFRLTIYFLGIYFAYKYDNNKKEHAFIWIILMLVGWVLMYYMYHFTRNDIQHVYPLLLITPGLVLLLAYILDKITIFNPFLKYIGQYSYQFYLFHLLTRDILYRYYGNLYFDTPVIGFDWFINLLAIVLALFISMIITKLIHTLMNKLVTK